MDSRRAVLPMMPANVDVCVCNFNCNVDNYNPMQTCSSIGKITRAQEDDHRPVMVDQILQTRQVSVLEPQSMIHLIPRRATPP